MALKIFAALSALVVIAVLGIIISADIRALFQPALFSSFFFACGSVMLFWFIGTIYQDVRAIEERQIEQTKQFQAILDLLQKQSAEKDEAQ